MLKRITVTNFQSVKDATLELGPLTVLVGPGRSGKSAIIRALRSALFNTGVDGFIRHGENTAVVNLTFDDVEDGRIQWAKQRGKGGIYGRHYFQNSTAYMKEFSKTGGAVPEEIASVFGIRELEVDGTTKLRPQFQEQGEYGFIIGETGSKQARILGALTKLDAVVSAQMECKKNRDEWGRKQKNYTEQAESLTSELESLPPVDELLHRLAATQANLDVAAETLSVIEQAEGHVLDLQRYGAVKDPSRFVELTQQARDATDNLVCAEEAWTAYDMASARLERTYSDVARTQEEVTAARQELEAACRDLGLCEECPLAVSA